MFLWIRGIVFTTSAKIFGCKAGNLSFNVRNWIKIFKRTSSKLSSGHVGCGFDNSAEKFWTEGQNFIAECRKQYENFFSVKYSFKMFRWKRKILFWQPCRNFSSERPKRFCSLSWKDGKQYFSGKIQCLKLFLRTRRMQFWRACRNFFHIRLQAFHSRSKKDGKKPAIFSKKNSSQCFDGLVKYCFDKPAEIFFAKKRQFFCSMSGDDGKKFSFFPKKYFSAKSLSTLKMHFWQPRRKNFEQNDEKVSFSVLKRWKFLQKIILIWIFSLTRRMQFWKLSPNLFCQKFEDLPLNVRKRLKLILSKNKFIKLFVLKKLGFHQKDSMDT